MKLITRYFSVVVTALIISLSVSCSNEEFQPHQIYGSWKLRDVLPQEGLDVEVQDRSTFFRNDSVSGETLVDGKLEHQISGTFKMDSANRTITLTIGDSIFTYQIKKLTEDDFWIYDPLHDRVTRCIRF